MKKCILLFVILSIFFGISIAKADISPASLWKFIGTAIQPMNSNWTIGSNVLRVTKGWFSDLDSTNATFGTLNISSFAAGPMKIGTSTPPDIVYQYDTNTGLGWISNDKQALYTGGTARLTIDSSGNVGIGTTTPQRKLWVTNAGANAQIGLEDTGAAVNQHYGAIGFSQGDFSFNTMTDALASTTRMVISNTGNVGIGTANPLDVLDVSGAIRTNTGFKYGSATILSGATNVFVGSGGSTGTVNLQTISGTGLTLNTGNVGIGTTAPLGKLDINAGDNPTYNPVRIFQYGQSGASPRFVSFYANGTAASPTVATANNVLGGFFGDGYTGSGTNYSNGASAIAFKANQTFSGTAWGSYITFTTTANDTISPAERMRIDNAGNVGIGTTGPDRPLTFARSVGEKISLYSNSATVRDYFGLAIEADTLAFQVPASKDISFYDSSTVNLIIKGSGNVGIGTTTPATALDVNGIIKTSPASTATCNALSEGGIYYDREDKHFMGCNGTTWVQLDN